MNDTESTSTDERQEMAQKSLMVEGGDNPTPHKEQDLISRIDTRDEHGSIEKLAREIDASEDVYLVTRNNQIVQVTKEQMTPEERSAFEDAPSDLRFEGNPIEDPLGFIAFLEKNNPEYFYDPGLLDEEKVRRAIMWANDTGNDVSKLSPAQIELSQNYVSGEKTNWETSIETIQKREASLRTNKDELEKILAPSQMECFHATYSLDNVNSILMNGLYCDALMGLGGTAAGLRSVPPDADASARDEVVESNLKSLADPHRGYRYEIIIQLPPLSPDQKADYDARRASDENVAVTSYYVQRLAEPVGIQGGTIVYDAVLPPEYIVGYLDLDTGKLFPRMQEVSDKS